MNLRSFIRQFPRLRITRLSGRPGISSPLVPGNHSRWLPVAWCTLCGESATGCECDRRVSS